MKYEGRVGNYSVIMWELFVLCVQYCRSYWLFFGSSLLSGMKVAELPSHFLNERKGREECWHAMLNVAVR